MTIRFPANVPNDMWPEAYGVFAALDAGDTAEAQRRWDASTKTPDGTYCQRSVGAVQQGYNEFNTGKPVVLKGTLPGGGISLDFDYDAPGSVYAFEVQAGNIGSGSVIEGGEGLYGGFSDTLPSSANPFDPEVFPTWGKVAVNGVPVGPGKYLLLYSESPKLLKGRASAG